MNWYIAKISFHINHGNDNGQSQFDEQLRLVKAATSADAFIKARLLGKSEELAFVNENGHEVQWKFIDVADIQPLDSLDHGTSLYSFTHEEEESHHYINFIRRKAQALQVREMVFA